MSKFKGTSGKWFIRKNGLRFGITKNRKSESSFIDCWFGGIAGVENKNEAKANALLISKAPELLEMLIEFNTMCDKIRFPTESELKEMKNKSDLLIKQATEL